MKYLFPIFFGLLHPNEINVANSIDWLCYNSTHVATVQVNEVKDEHLKWGEVESEVGISVTVATSFKGDLASGNAIRIYSRLSYIGVDKWNEMKGKTLLVFLQKPQGEKEAGYWIWDDDRGMVDIKNTGSKMITGTFKVLNTKEQIYLYGRECIKKVASREARPYFLETPYDSEAFPALYAGSACYLVVPDVFYPASKNSM